ncbi:copper resistance CopC family protein [Solicola sp. PLA-1-18]|uniref:copper resistance CopC family protein n=1 Tax=Solicola sp. PLA-1-18 TaxID=3380532 RepID=UPI003B7A289A
MTSSAGRRLAQLLAAVALCALTVVGGGASADAHAVLVSSTPADGSTLATEPGEVSLTFNEPVSSPAYLVVESPDGTELTQGEADVVDGTVSHRVETSGQAGRYRLAYRVVSADGHPISGTLHYTVTAGRTVEQKPDDPADETSFVHRHREHLMWGAGGVVAAAGLLLWPLRRSRD